MMPLVVPALSTALFTSSTLPPFVVSPLPLFVLRRRGAFPPRNLRCKNVSIEPPPLEFDFRAETRQETVAMIQQLYPNLSDLAEDGDMVIIKRPLDYVERRTDGYVEPELIILIGTSHVSVDSAANVERILKAVRPENVVVELCRSRAGIMYSGKSVKPVQGRPTENQETNLFSIGGGSFVSAMGRSLNLGGQSALALQLLLAGFSKNMSSSIGTPIGDEFCVARKASEEIGAQIVLGDRPIEITLERAWKALRWNEQLGFINTLIQGTFFHPLDVSKGNLEKLKTDDSLSTMFKELSMFYPSLLQPLIYERDVYLAWSLKRSKAVNGSKKVVGIIGRGHMRGVVHALKHDHNHLRFRDLVGGKKPKDDNMKNWVKSLVKGFIRDTLITIIVLWFVDHQNIRFWL